MAALVWRNRSFHIHSFVHRRVYSELTDIPPPQSSPFRRIESSFTRKVVSLLHTINENNWSDNEELHHLLFPRTKSGCSLDPFAMVQIAGNLGESEKAFKFFEYVRTNSHSAPSSLPLLSSIFRSILELASRESESHQRLSDLFDIMLNYKIPLLIDSATLLIRSFGEAGMMSKSVLVYNELDLAGMRNTHVCNTLLEVLFSNYELDYALQVQVLREILGSKTKFQPNKRTMDLVLTSFLRSDLMEMGHLYVDENMKIILKLMEHGLCPPIPMLTPLMKTLCRNSNSKQASDILAKAMKMSDNVKAPSCNVLLNSLNSFEEMNLLVADMKEKGVQPDAITFGILIIRFCKFHRMNEAMEVFERMQTADAIIFNALINGFCKVGKHEAGLELLTRMKSERIHPTAATYSGLIYVLCKVGKVAKAFELFETMKTQGLEPNIVTLNSLVYGLRKQGSVQSALDFYDENSAIFKPNIVTYSFLIKAYCNLNNIEKALTIFNDMSKANIWPDCFLYSELISCLTLAGRLNEASSITSQMKQSGFALDITTYNTLIRDFCRKNQREKAYEIIKDMEKSGVKPDVFTYNTLISHMSNFRDLGDAGEIMARMKAQGVKPTIVTYSSLIQKYCSDRNFEEALKIFEHISRSSSKVSPNLMVYNILIRSLCKNGEVKKAIFFMHDMKMKEVRPNTATFNPILKGVYMTNNLEKGLEIMDMMIESRCHPDFITMEILNNWLPNVGQSDKLKRFVQSYTFLSEEKISNYLYI